MNKKKVSKKSTTLFSNNKTGVLRFHAANRSSRKLLLLWVVLLCFCTGSSAIAQTTLALGNFNEGKQVDDPMMLTQGEGWRRSMYIYPKELLMEALAKEYELARNYDAFKRKQEQTFSGQPAFYFNSLAMFRLSDEYSLPPNSSKFRIYVRNSEANKFENGTTWKQQTKDAILVFDGDPTGQVGYANGLTTFLFSKAVPWTGNNLQVMFEFYTSQGNETKEPLKWAAADGIAQIAFDIQSGLVANGLHHPPADNIFNTGVQTHPDLRIGFTTESNPAFQSIGQGHVAETEKSPIRKGAVGRNRNVYIYPWTMLSGIKSGSYIQSLELYRLSELNSLAPGNQLKIYLKNSIDYSFDQNTPSDWNGLLADAVLVYQGDPKEIVGNSSGYKLFPFINPFPYAGDNLQVMFEYVKNDDNGGTDDIEWASSNPETDRDLDENQGRVLIETGGLPAGGNSLLAEFTVNIPTLRLGTANGMEKLAAFTDATASNGAVVTNGKRTYVINRVIYRPNKAEAITDDKPYQASSGKLFKSNYLLLHQLATNGVVNEQYVQGKLTARMGSNVVENHKIDLDINSSASNQQNTAGMVSYGDPAKLVTLTYKGTPYLAVEIPIYTSIESSLTDFAFTGYLQNDRLQLLAGSDLNQVDTASIAAYREKFDPVSNISSTANKMVVSGGLVVGSTVGARETDTDNGREYIINHPVLVTNGDSWTTDAPVSEPCFLLLHRAVTSNDIVVVDNKISNGAKSAYVMGKITGIRGSSAEWNRKWTVEVNTASAYDRNRGSVLTYNENKAWDGSTSANLVMVKYKEIVYMALKIPTNSRLQDFSFTGYAANYSLQIVTFNNSDLENGTVLNFPEQCKNHNWFKGKGKGDDPGTVTNEFDPIGVQGDLSVLNNLTLQQFKGEDAKGKTLAVDNEGNVIISKSTGNTYSFKDATKEGGQIGWFKMGTLSIPQGGYNAMIKMYAGSSFNGVLDQNGATELFLRTSNGSGGNTISATATRYGQNPFIDKIKIVSDDAGNNLYDIYVQANMFIGNGYYTVDGFGTGWTEECGAASNSNDPSNSFTSVQLVPFELRTRDKVFIGDCSTHPTTNDYLLDVAGKIRANKLTVNTTGADFVFDSSYHLPPLHQVEQFIQKEHHLPGIASAKDMQTNGLDVGDNQTKLLQKVEELTLYVIQLQKEVDRLKKKKKKK